MSERGENLNKAKELKNDEFYTTREAVEAELKHYKDQFKDKTIFCPCDSGESEFVKFLSDKFQDWGLKKLIWACNRSKLVLSYDRSYRFSILEKNHDCFSDTSKEIMKNSDIIVTNPPFSLFRAFLQQIYDIGVKYLVIGSLNALSYTVIFNKFKDGELWLGHKTGTQVFKVPEPVKNAFEENGQLFVRLGNICWYTNLENTVQDKELKLSDEYPEFEQYDNYPAVEIPKITQIPKGLRGQAGVPITFLTKFCPKQFKIIGKSDQLAGPIEIDGVYQSKPGRFYLNGKRLYERIVIEAV